MTAKQTNSKRDVQTSASASSDKQRDRGRFARFLAWLENGDDALDAELQASLEDETAMPDSFGQSGKGTECSAEETISREEAIQKAVENGVKCPKDTKVYRKKTDSKSFSDSVWYKAAAVGICAALIGLIMFTVIRMPRFGGADTLVDSEVSSYYTKNAMEETGAVNIVTGIILDYRGFDTLGESHVLFIAVCAVLLMLSIKGEKDEARRLARAAYEQRKEPRDDLILQSAARILTPLILIFGLYIVFNGHLSPGGGFSGGAVLGAGLILYQNAFGYEKIERFFTFRTFRIVSVICLLSYSAMKGYHFFTGANHVQNGVSAGQVGRIFSAGLLLPLNLVVGGVVACTMYALYTMFRRGEF